MGIIDAFLDFLTARRMTIAEESMLPALRPGDRVVFSARALRRRPLQRGDIVLIKAPDSRGRLDVKRIVGLPGETLVVRGSTVRIGDRLLDEPYLADWVSSSTDGSEVEIGSSARQYVVLSDNRVNPGAVDSRRYGPIGRERIVGILSRRF